MNMSDLLTYKFQTKGQERNKFSEVLAWNPQ